MGKCGHRHAISYMHVAVRGQLFKLVLSFCHVGPRLEGSPLQAAVAMEFMGKQYFPVSFKDIA